MQKKIWMDKGHLFSDSVYVWDLNINVQSTLFSMWHWFIHSFWSINSLIVRFMKFNNRIIRKILIRDTCPESSIVALYKKLELQNAMEILDTMSGDISAAPTDLISLQYVSFLHSHFFCFSEILETGFAFLFLNLAYINRAIISVEVCGHRSITMICFLLICSLLSFIIVKREKMPQSPGRSSCHLMWQICMISYRRTCTRSDRGWVVTECSELTILKLLLKLNFRKQHPESTKISK